MPYEPVFRITPRLLALSEEIAALRQRIETASIELAWIPRLQHDSRIRNAHASTAIEGNPLTMPEVRALADAPDRPGNIPRPEREVVNYFAGLRFIEAHSSDQSVTEADVLSLHRILAARVMDQGDAGSYRTIRVQVGLHRPPPPEDVPDLMRDLLDWWNGPSAAVSPLISSAVIHYRVEAIHPFGDGNGRIGRALSLWEMYRRGFDSRHIFSVDEFYWRDRPAYYAALHRVDTENGDLTSWLEFCADGMRETLEQVWARIQAIPVHGDERLILSRNQERLLGMLSAQGSMAPSEIWATLGMTKQGAMKVIGPLLDAGLIERTGTRKSGRYRLRSE